MNSVSTLRRFLFFSAFVIGHSSLARSAEPAYRTDAGGNDKLPWFQLKPGEFPPEGSAHEIAGELTSLDHINRTGTLRQDRTDAISRAHWDQQLPFTLLSFGLLRFHGAPAELKDVPLGTHLHGRFYFDEKAGPKGKGEFTKALLLEDDFSYYERKKHVWRVQGVEAGKITLSLVSVTFAQQLDAAVVVEAGKITLSLVSLDPKAKAAYGKPTAFLLYPSTQIWKGRAIGTLADLQKGQQVQVNLTVCTLKGPGRCTDIWIDPESREVASAHQVEVHRLFEHEHGLPGWVDEVDNPNSIVTVTLFAGFDPRLKDDFVVGEPVSSAVAEDNLRTYDQNSDRMGGSVLEVQTVPAAPGSSGVRIKFKTVTLIEGHRPKHILRLFSGKWKVDDLPKEERLYQ